MPNSVLCVFSSQFFYVKDTVFFLRILSQFILEIPLFLYQFFDINYSSYIKISIDRKQ